MKDVIYEVLDLIEQNGFECYVVGGFVRDKIIGIVSKDVDIITNAKPKDLFNIFKNNIKVKEEYGSVKLVINEYHIDITTYRKDIDYKKNRPSSVEYIDDVFEDLKRRDFTMNTLLMNKEGKIIDLMNAINDISSKTIKVVGDINTKFEEDTLRLLRALRFMTILGFKLDENIKRYIINNKIKFESISYYKRKEEFDKIFTSKNVRQFLEFIKKYDMEKYLGIKYSKLILTPTVIGIWSQIEFDDNFPFNKIEKKQIEDIKNLVIKNTITKYDIYKYGSYICMNAAIIMKKSPKKINKIYTKLPIKDIIEIDINCEEICNTLNISPGKTIGKIYNILEKDIIDGKVKNNKKDLLKYIKKVKI